MNNYRLAWQRYCERRSAIRSFKDLIKTIKRVIRLLHESFDLDHLTVLCEFRSAYTDILIANTYLTAAHINTTKDCEQKNQLLWLCALRQTGKLNKLACEAREADLVMSDFIERSLQLNQEKLNKKIEELHNAPE